MPETTNLSVIATVAGDPRRCELHRQCDNLSRRVFRRGGHHVRLHVGPGADIESLSALQRLIRSCPMDALTLISTEPAASPDYQEQQ